MRVNNKPKIKKYNELYTEYDINIMFILVRR